MGGKTSKLTRSEADGKKLKGVFRTLQYRYCIRFLILKQVINTFTHVNMYMPLFCVVLLYLPTIMAVFRKQNDM